MLAFQVDWWRGESRGAVPTTTTIWNTGLIVQWYPPQGHGLHVTAGAGVGFVSADVATPIPNEDVDAHGLGYQLGIGYDLRLSPHVWLSPYASFFGTPGARPSDSRETLNARAGQIGLGLTWR